MYYKNQSIIIPISIIALVYNLFFYFDIKKIDSTVELKSYTVILQSCRSYRRSSFVKINYRNKYYTIRLANGECPKYPTGSKIDLKYNAKFDYFFKADGLKRDRFRVTFVSVIFVLSIIPWKKINLQKNLRYKGKVVFK